MSDAQILDRGYRKFDGQRSGVAGAVRSVAWHTARSILGLGRSGRHKVFPIIVVVVAFLPALGFLALAILVGDLLQGELRPEYWEMFGFSFFPALLFTGLVAPEAIVRDRGNGMYPLYLSTPLTRPTYLVAKVAAVVATMAIVVLGPPVLALLGYTFQSLGPDGFPSWMWVLARLIVAGAIICGVYTAVSLGAASLTDRRAFASVAVILLMLGLSIATNALVENADIDRHLLLLDPFGLPLGMAPRVFGEAGNGEYDGVSTLVMGLACAAWAAGGAGVVASRYRKLAAV